MPAGRPPKPPHLKADAKPGEIGAGMLPSANPEDLNPPANVLTRESEEMFRIVVNELTPAGLIHRLSTPSLVRYCRAWEQWKRAQRELDFHSDYPDVCKDELRYWSTVSKQSAREMSDWEREHGVGPASAARIGSLINALRNKKAPKTNDAEAIIEELSSS